MPRHLFRVWIKQTVNLTTFFSDYFNGIRVFAPDSPNIESLWLLFQVRAKPAIKSSNPRVGLGMVVLSHGYFTKAMIVRTFLIRRYPMGKRLTEMKTNPQSPPPALSRNTDTSAGGSAKRILGVQGNFFSPKLLSNLATIQSWRRALGLSFASHASGESRRRS